LLVACVERRAPLYSAIFIDNRYFATMSVFSVTPKEGNPVTFEVLDEVCQSLKVTVKDEEKDNYRKLLAVFHESVEELMAMPEFEPETDIERIPRENVHFPEEAANEYGAWAWKVRIRDQRPRNWRGVLEGKTVALKGQHRCKGCPMLLGTAFVKGYVPVGMRRLVSSANAIEECRCNCHDPCP
jgi:amidase